MERENILFVSIRNSCRSQIAEQILRKLAGDKYDCYSAGVMPKEISPYALKALQEIGIEGIEPASNSITEYLGKKVFHNIIFIGRLSDRVCPHVFPGMGERILWDIDAPSTLACDENEKLERYRQIRDQIRNRIKKWLKEQEKANATKTPFEKAVEQIEQETTATEIKKPQSA